MNRAPWNLLRLRHGVSALLILPALLVTCCRSAPALPGDNPTSAATQRPEIIAFAGFRPDGFLVTVGRLAGTPISGCHGTYTGDIVSVWNPETGRRINRREVDRILEEVLLSPNGEFLVSWDTRDADHWGDGSIRIYSLDHSRPVVTLGGPSGVVSSVAVTPDSTRIIAAYYYEADRRIDHSELSLDRKHNLKIWNVRTWSVTWQSSIPEYCDMTTSPDGKYVAVYGTQFCELVQIDRPKATSIPAWDHGFKLGFSSDSKLLASEDDGSMSYYGVPSGQKIAKPKERDKAYLERLLSSGTAYRSTHAGHFRIDIISKPGTARQSQDLAADKEKERCRVTDLQTGIQVAELPCEEYYASYALRPDGKVLYLDNAVYDLSAGTSVTLSFRSPRDNDVPY